MMDGTVEKDANANANGIKDYMNVPDDNGNGLQAVEIVQNGNVQTNKTVPENAKDVQSIKKKRRKWRLGCGPKSHVFFQSFTMAFLAEWGDRSQMATLVIAATENVWGTCVGGY